MHILYLYIHEIPLLKNQNINLGGRYRFHYDHLSKRFHISLNPFYIDSFFDVNKDPNLAKVSNLSAVVGQNGAGKTTLLEFFKEHLIPDVGGTRTSIILAVEDKGKVLIYRSQDIGIVDQNLNDFDLEMKILKVDYTSYVEDTPYRLPAEIDAFETTSYIHFSNVFDGKPEYATDGLKDISTNFLVGNDHKREVKARTISSDTDLLDAYFGNEIERQMDFINFFEGESPIGFALPEWLEVAPRNILEPVSYKYTRKEIDKITKSGLEPLLDGLLASQKVVSYEDKIVNWVDSAISFFERVALSNFIHELVFNADFTVIDESFISLLKNTNYAESKDVISLLGKMLEMNSSNGLIQDYGHILDHLGSFINDLPTFITPERVPLRFEGRRFQIPLNKEVFKKFYDNYKRCYKSRPFLSFFWAGISSGEKAYLNILSRFFSLSDRFLDDKHKLADNIIVLIDEGDVYLHPEWQRQFSYLLLRFLPVIFARRSGTQRSIQIIFSTNSPIPVSDIPNSNVVFLKRSSNQTIVMDSLEDKKLTFGANIHTLLADSFFLNNGLIGEFAKSKINGIIEVLQGDKDMILKERPALEVMIAQIGEPLIKSKLVQMMSERLQMNMMDVDGRISRLEKEIEQLKKQRK